MATSIPQDDFMKTALRLPRELHSRLMEAAQSEGRSLNSELIERLQATFKPQALGDGALNQLFLGAAVIRVSRSLLALAPSRPVSREIDSTVKFARAFFAMDRSALKAAIAEVVGETESLDRFCDVLLNAAMANMLTQDSSRLSERRDGKPLDRANAADEGKDVSGSIGGGVASPTAPPTRRMITKGRKISGKN